MNNLPLQPLVWQDLDEDPMLAPVSISESPLHHYVALKDGEGIKVRYSKKGADFDYATGFATIDEAKAWAWKHYNEKMQPYVKPMPTWISVDNKLPDASGDYLTFNGYDMKVNQWNKNGWLLIYEGIMITHWMPLPKPPSEADND